jgi:hypothetical protein|tara:strand:+ start:2641 stop:3306 length:666 start_codon:yes stop_codon:yes gene_type:complete
MATTKVVDVLDRAAIILQDNTNVRFPNEELLKFFNDAQKEVVLHRPDARMVNTTFDCASGSKQTLPSAALRLIEVIRNVGGRAVTQVQKRILDETLPNWHETVASTNKIEHFIYDPSDPKNFYIYPKGASGTHSLEIVYSSSPAEIAVSNFSTDTQVISVDDVYANCILDYVLYRSYQKDSEFAGNPQRAMMHYQSFANALGVKTQADVATTPMPASAGAM